MVLVVASLEPILERQDAIMYRSGLSLTPVLSSPGIGLGRNSNVRFLHAATEHDGKDHSCSNVAIESWHRYWFLILVWQRCPVHIV